MPITEEMRQQFVQQIEAYRRFSGALTQIREEISQEAVLPLADGEYLHSTDLRAENCFAEFYDPESGAQTNQEIRERNIQFFRDYESGSPARRRPYLERFAQEFDEIQFDLDGDLEEKMRELIQTNGIDYKLWTDRLCYIQNLQGDNPEFFEEYYDTPVKKHLLKSTREMSAAINFFAQTVYAEAGYIYNSLRPVAPETARSFIDTKDESLIKAAAQYHLYQSSMAAAQGRDFKGSLSFRIPESYQETGKEADKLREGAGYSDSAAAKARGLYSVLINQVFDSKSEQGKLLERAGMSEYDMIMINGRSASELFGERCGNPADRTYRKQMEQYIIGALTSGKDRVEIATMHYAPDSSLKVQVSALHPDLTAIQPDKKEEYSWFRRTFFDWGPFRCKTRQEKLDALLANDSDKEPRAERIQNQVLSRIQSGIRYEVSQKAKNAVESSYYQEHLEQEFYGTIRTEAEQSQHFLKLGADNSLFTLNRGTSRMSLGILVLMSRGYSLDEILKEEPSMLQEKRQAGLDVEAMLVNKDKDALMEVCRQAGNAILKEQLPVMKDLSPESVIQSYQKAEILKTLMLDYRQIFALGSGSWERKEDKSFYQEVISKTYGAGIYCGSLCDVVLGYNEASGIDGETFRKTGDAVAGKAMLEAYYDQFNGAQVGKIAVDDLAMNAKALIAQGEVSQRLRGRERDFRDILFELRELPREVKEAVAPEARGNHNRTAEMNERTNARELETEAARESGSRNRNMGSARTFPGRTAGQTAPARSSDRTAGQGRSVG